MTTVLSSGHSIDSTDAKLSLLFHFSAINVSYVHLTGVVVVYDRNYVTNQILEDSGIRVLKMPSAELSRGRGGPRCMSMPLWRDEI